MGYHGSWPSVGQRSEIDGGVLERIDAGRGFRGTQLGFSTAGYAQADGRAERTNQSVENVLRSFVDYNQADWDVKLFAVEFAITVTRM